MGCLGWVIIILVIWWIVVDPYGAAHAAHQIAHLIDVVFTGVARFLDSRDAPAGPS